MEPILFLIGLLVIGVIAKNQSLIIAVAFLLALKFTGLGEKWFSLFQQKGINWGVTIITIAVLVPIASGEIGFRQLSEALRSSYAWIALLSGVFVAIIASRGLHLLQNDPHITAALVFGTILAVALFKGVAVGPLIGAGIAYMAMKIVGMFTGS
ncbi:DUF441 domain-containing protein [Fictibacillus sp. b24]|uniref:DUF441 domain-containing protein n=1 Tax=Fictibacillus sp. b24 TaxID=3055863 RepID=UPI0025A0F172|nr:DUF441 domain-containing protein [Fictibacillus sp. b24]MDM5315595.1 DUF441 domain-containing protein [Fictibacillus sp. b24]